MEENQEGSRTPVPSTLHTIVLGGLAVGVLDATAASLTALLRGGSPERVWQYVASSLLGTESFDRGTTSVLIGLLIHFGVAFGVAAVFYLLARIFPLLLRRPVASGIIYGIVVYFAMAYAIVPMTAVKQGGFSWSGLAIGIITHIVCVGLPPAIIAKRFAR